MKKTLPLLVALFLATMGLFAQLQFEPGSVDFGQHAITSTTNLEVVITSQINQQVTLSGLSAPFTATPASFAIVIGEQKTITITFNPHSGGSFNGTLTATGSIWGTTQMQVSGYAAPATVSFSQTSLDFGNILMTGYSEQMIYVQSDIAQQVTLSNLALPFAASPETINLLPDQPAPVYISFYPTEPGYFSGVLVATANLSGTAQANIFGTGDPASIFAFPQSLEFSSLLTGETDTLEIIITTDINQNIALSGLSDVFSFTPANLTMIAGEAQTVLVSFNPTNPGSFNQNLQLDGSLYGTLAVPVHGECIDPKINVSPTSLDFGEVPLLSPKTMQFTISNSGNGTLNCSFTKGNPHFTLPQATVSIPQGGSSQISVIFTPDYTPVENDTLLITSNDPDNPEVQIPMNGSGVSQVSGEACGTWYKANSPYYFVGSVTVPYGCTLNIEPGVYVNGNGGNFIIQGKLICNGLENDSIQLLGVGYLQLSTSFPNDSIDYTVIDGSSIGSTYIEGHGIKIKHANVKACYLINYQSTLSILNSKFKGSAIDNYASNLGTLPAMQIDHSKLLVNISSQASSSSIEIKNSELIQAAGDAIRTNGAYSKVFLENVSIKNAGNCGIYTHSNNSSVEINNSSISNCGSTGVYTNYPDSPINVSNSTIANNGRDGIYAQGGFSPITIENSNILNNQRYGIISYSTSSVNQVIQSTVSGNKSSGIYFEYSQQTLILIGSIVSKNIGNGIFAYNCYVFAENSIVSANQSHGIYARYFYGNYLTSVFNNGKGIYAESSIEISYLFNSIVCLNNTWGSQYTGNFEFLHSKVSGDPKLADSLGHLLPTSPCIDAADPTEEDTNIPFGMGTVRADMGAYGGPENWIWGGNPIPANGEPDIVKIVDLPQDQGKMVGLHYSASLFDGGNSAYDVTKYSFWRELDENGKRNIVASKTPTGQYFQKGAEYWEYVGEMPAMGFQNYGYSAPTHGDSTINGMFWSKFIVVAHTANTSVYWVSLPDSGYSVDNLAPAAPMKLAGAVAGVSYNLQWTPSPEEDLQYYAVYRGTDGNFETEPFATTTEPVFPNITLNTDEYEYAVAAFDHSGNRSNLSNAITAPIYDAFTVPQGWSGISSWIMPNQPELENVLAPLSVDLIILYNQTGVYWPGQSVNTLGDWESHSGYVVKLGSEKALPMVGFKEQNTVFGTNAGWQILPVLSACAVPTAGLQVQPASSVVMIKEIAGWRVFWPEMGIATLGELLPGKAYFVLTGSVGNIEFPDCEGMKSLNLTGLEDLVGLSPDLSAFKISTTPVTHIIAIPAAVMTNLETNDVIAVFDHSGTCAGAITLQDKTQASALTVFGDDPTTSVKEGLAEGETLHFKVYKSETGTFADAEVSFETAFPNNNGTFATNGVSALASLKVGALSTSPEETENIQVFPNPGNGKFTVSGISDGNRLEVTDAKGQIIWTGISETETMINLSGRPTGLYLLKISKADKISIVKLVIE